MNRLTRIGTAVALAAATSLAFSQAPPGAGGPGGPGGPGGGPGAANPEAQAKTAIEARQAVFKLISNQNGPIGAAGRGTGPAPDLAVIARNAARVQMLADMIPEMFAANPTAPATVKTRALPAIWTGQADFKAKADALSKAAGAVATAAKSGDAAATKTAAAEISKACSGCHDTYRGPPAQ